MITIVLIFAVIALLLTVAASLNPPRAPLWVAVLMLCIVALIQAAVPLVK